MPVSFLNLKRQRRGIEDETASALARVVESGVYILGGETEAFEREWAAYCGVRGAIGVNSGTDALTLALNASGAVRPHRGDEVITTPLTAGYTALAILNAGGVPVFADVDPETYTLDAHAVEKSLTPRTRAVVPVHLYGQMADMESVCAIAARHGLLVIEDAAQAHGAQLAGKRAGAYGHAAAFSFYPTKNLGAYGDGGAFVSDDLALVERVRTLRQGGHFTALQTEAAGCNSRLDEMQAALLRVKLKHLDAWNRERQRLAAFYDTALSGSGVVIPARRASEAHVHHLYVVRHQRRERLRRHLAARGIETLIHYPYLLHQQPLFRRAGQPSLPVAEKLVDEILSLPLYPQLTEAEAQEVTSGVLSFAE